MNVAGTTYLGRTCNFFGSESLRSVFITLVIAVFLSGCSATAGMKAYPKVSDKAKTLVHLHSNVQKTDFLIDGKRIATGRNVKVFFDDKPHTITVAPENYKSKEEYVQPPFNSSATYSFFFMVGDRLKSEVVEEKLNIKLFSSSKIDAESFVIDFDLPLGIPNPDAIAVIIGNKNYSLFSLDVPNVDYAHNDANLIRQVLIKCFGYSAENIIFLQDATQAQLLSVFGSEGNPQGRLAHWIKPGKSDVFVFYSGHGVPGLENQQAYLLPVDADPATIEINGYPLTTLYKNLQSFPVKSIVVALDACFSGLSSAGAVVKNASSIRLNRKAVNPVINKGIILTAAAKDQVASWDKDHRLGLFTANFVKALSGEADKPPYGNSDTKLNWKEVKLYVADKVSYAARREYGREQQPQFYGDLDEVLQ